MGSGGGRATFLALKVILAHVSFDIQMVEDDRLNFSCQKISPSCWLDEYYKPRTYTWCIWKLCPGVGAYPTAIASNRATGTVLPTKKRVINDPPENKFNILRLIIPMEYRCFFSVRPGTNGRSIGLLA